MSFTDQHRKQLQGLMEDPRWGSVEAFLDDYLLRNFALGSIKRATEFDTVWYAAEAEGAKRHIVQIFKEMELEASKVETK